MTKMTRRELIAAIRPCIALDHEHYEEIMSFLNREEAKLEAKKNVERKPTAKQIENASLKVEILHCLTENTAYTISDMIKTIPACANLSNQKVSAIVRQMLLEKSVDRYVDKRKTYFMRKGV